MKRLLAYLIVPAALAAGTDALAHERTAIPLTRQDGERLTITKASARFHDGTLTVSGWVKRPHGGSVHVPGSIRVELHGSLGCLDVRHVQWSPISRRFQGHFWLKERMETAPSSVAVSHVPVGDPNECNALGLRQGGSE